MKHKTPKKKYIIDMKRYEFLSKKAEVSEIDDV